MSESNNTDTGLEFVEKTLMDMFEDIALSYQEVHPNRTELKREYRKNAADIANAIANIHAKRRADIQNIQEQKLSPHRTIKRKKPSS